MNNGPNIFPEGYREFVVVSLPFFVVGRFFSDAEGTAAGQYFPGVSRLFRKCWGLLGMAGLSAFLIWNARVWVIGSLGCCSIAWCAGLRRTSMCLQQATVLAVVLVYV